MKITAEALDYIEDNFIEVDDEDLVAFVQETLVRPEDAYFRDGELYVTHTLAFHTPAWDLTDEYIIGQANYRDALDILEPLGAEAATVGHWTYSTFECIKVPMLTEDGAITAAAVALWELHEKMRDYPLLSDETHSELETEINDEAMQSEIEYAERERDIVLDDDQKYAITSTYWVAWEGYREPGYIDSDKLNDIIDRELSGELQQHQETKLW